MDTNLYSSSEVAKILDVPEWRINNFSSIKAYGPIQPTKRIGKGRGSRRLYGETEIVTMALAQRLLDSDISPEAVGRVLTKIPNSLLTPNRKEMAYASIGQVWWKDAAPSSSNVLMKQRGEWKIVSVETADKQLGSAAKSSSGTFVLNLRQLRNETLESVFMYEDTKTEEE